MTLMEIWTITHIHAVNEPYPRPSPAYMHALATLLRSRLITEDVKSANGFKTTVAGADYVRRLKEVTP